MNTQIPDWYDVAVQQAQSINKSLKNSLQERFFSKLFDESLCGTCAIGSASLEKILKSYGAVLVSGDYVVSDESFTPHCWVEIENYIIDCTYTQFEDASDVKIIRAGTRLFSRYRKLFVDKKAKRDIRSWDGFQSPKFWKLDKTQQVFIPSFRMYQRKYHETQRSVSLD